MSELKVLAIRHADQSRQKDLSDRGAGIDTSKLAAFEPAATALRGAVGNSVITFASSPMRRTHETAERLLGMMSAESIHHEIENDVAFLSEKGFYLMHTTERADKYRSGIRKLAQIALGNAHGQNAALVLVTHDVIIEDLINTYTPRIAQPTKCLGMVDLSGPRMDALCSFEATQNDSFSAAA